MKFNEEDKTIAEQIGNVLPSIVKPFRVYGRYIVDIAQTGLDVAHRFYGESTYTELEELGYIDSLTGCYTRGKFLNLLESHQRNEGSPIVIGFSDIVDLARFNNSYGHSYGDAALKIAAWSLNSNFSDAFIGRFGGDEFVLAVKPIKDKEEEKSSLKTKQINAVREAINLEAYSVTNPDQEHPEKVEHRGRVNVSALLLKHHEGKLHLPKRVLTAAKLLMSVKEFEIILRYNFAEIDFNDSPVLESFDEFMREHGVKDAREIQRITK